MRVLHIVPSLDPDTGGPARSVPALCAALQAAGVDVSLYTFSRTGTAPAAPAKDTTFPIEFFKPWLGSREFPTPSFYRHLRDVLGRFDLVHLHALWNPAISVAAWACRQARVPYVLSPRGMLQTIARNRKRWLKTSYYWFLERHTIAGARALHFFTDAEARDSQSLLKGSKPSLVIPSGVDPALARGVEAGRFRKTYSALADKQIALFLGRLHWSKGLDLQADAVVRLVKEFPTLMWVLVGPDAGEWNALSNRIRALGLERHVLWTGLLPHEQCLEALADADVFLLTSRHEAHSAAMNEALAVGVPLVITDTVQFEEVGQWGAGLVVPWDAGHLAAAVAEILKNRDTAERLRETGRRLVAEHLAWPKVAHAMVRAYEGIRSKEGLRL